MNKYLFRISRGLEKLAGDGQPKSGAWVKFRDNNVAHSKQVAERKATEEASLPYPRKETKIGPAAILGATRYGVAGAVAGGIFGRSIAGVTMGALTGAIIGGGGHAQAAAYKLTKNQEALTKKAFEFKNQHTKDLVDTGVIAGLGGVGNMLSGKLLKQHNAFSAKTFAVGTGVGLVADYAGIKINKALGHTKKETNVPL